MPGFMVHAGSVRLLVFVSVFAILAWLEDRNARRVFLIPRSARWPGNLSLTALNTVLLRVIFPLSGVGAAYWARVHRFGFFNRTEVPEVFAVVFSIVFLDWMIYYQHRAFHAVPFLWKIHRTHHIDREVDVTTGIRFHPLEMVLSMLFKWAVILAMGAPMFGVFLFEILLNASSLFSHANILISLKWDKVLRYFIVTPDMHRVHHSILPRETNSNFGFNLSWWDRLLGTYRPEPEKGQEGMTLGLEDFRELRYLYMDRIILLPFTDREGRVSWKNIFRRD